MALSVLVVVDRRFSRIEGQSYTEGSIGAETGERYLAWFDSVVLAGRKGISDGLRSDRLNRVGAEGLNVVYLPDISGITRRFRNRAAARQTLRILIDRADAVIARLPTELGLEAAQLAIIAGKPLAVDVGGCVLQSLRSHGSVSGRVYAPFAFQRMRAAVRQSGWVSYVTQSFLQARYPAANGARTLACSNVEIDDAPPELLGDRLARIKSSPSILTFGTIGTLHNQYKGIQHALAALERASPRLPSFCYRVLGSGEQAHWKALAGRHNVADITFFDGTLPAGSVRQWLDGIDVYLQPSLTEGLPRSLIEAMSRACPAIASNVGGIPELLPEAVLHEPADTKRLAMLIEAAAAPALRATMAARNWTRSKDFSRARLDGLRDGFWSEFRDVVAARKRQLR